MSKREYIFKPGQKKSDIAKAASVDATAASVRLEIADGVTTREAVKACDILRQRLLEVDGET